MTAKPDKLTDFSDDELKAELAKRRKAVLQARAAELEAKASVCRVNLPLLLSLHARHDCTSCSDSDPCNGGIAPTYGPRCIRCFLIACQKEHDWPEYAEIKLSIERVILPKE